MKWQKVLLEKLENNGRNAANQNAGIRVGSDLHLAEMAYEALTRARRIIHALRESGIGGDVGYEPWEEACIEADKFLEEVGVIKPAASPRLCLSCDIPITDSPSSLYCRSHRPKV